MKKIHLHLPLLLLFMCLSCKRKIHTIQQNAVPANATAFEDPPEWSKEAIWYQIFVERFRNGDSANDPTPADIAGAYPGFVPAN